MANIGDEDIAVWFCPNNHETQRFGVTGPKPLATRCGRCGEQYAQRCENPDCPAPIFHPSDEHAYYHRACGWTMPFVHPFVPPGLLKQQVQSNLEPATGVSEGPTAANEDERRRDRIRELAGNPANVENEQVALAEEAEWRRGRGLRVDTTEQRRSGDAPLDHPATVEGRPSLASGMAKIFGRGVDAGVVRAIEFGTLALIVVLVYWLIAAIQPLGIEVPDPPDLWRLLAR